MPPEDATHARGHKYPFLSAEIFNCELNTVLEKFFEAPEPPTPDKNDESKDDDQEEEKDNKENLKRKLTSNREPISEAMDGFRPPYEGDDDPDDDVKDEDDKKEKEK